MPFASAYVIAKKLKEDSVEEKFEKGLETVAEAIEELEQTLLEALSKAVSAIKEAIKSGFNEFALYEVERDCRAMLRLLDEYLAAPTSERMEHLTHDSMFIVEGFKSVPFPGEYGLNGVQGHTGFMQAATIRAAILHQRIKDLSPEDRFNLITHLRDAVEHARLMHEYWKTWNRHRFTALYVSGSYGMPRMFVYDIDNSPKPTKVKAPMEGTGEYLEAYAKAEGIRGDDIEEEWKLLKERYVTPSRNVVYQWKEELKNLGQPVP